jgi:hypothetical protein
MYSEDVVFCAALMILLKLDNKLNFVQQLTDHLVRSPAIVGVYEIYAGDPERNLNDAGI